MLGPVFKTPLGHRVSGVLREAIRRGDFGEYLLPERQLSQELKVGRPTLRAALAELEREGLIAAQGRRGWRIVPSQRTKRRRFPGAVVRMLQDDQPSSRLNEHLQAQKFLAEHLHGPGMEFHVETAPACFSKKPAKALQRLVRSHPADLWVLYRTTREIQRWFQEQGLSCIVFGTPYPGVDFLSIEEDYRATCRHAAGVFLARGHTRMALLTAESARPGDQMACEGFLEAIRNSPRKAHCEIVSHGQSLPRICRTVDALLKRPERPTGWLVFTAQTYLTILSHLALRGIQVGREISLICRNSDPYFEVVVPKVVHYRRNVSRMNRKLLEAIQQCLSGVPPTTRQWLISSEFHDGESVLVLK